MRFPRIPLLLAAALAVAAPSHAKDEGAFHPRVIGGVPAPADEYPWMVALVRADEADYARGQFCGGILISEEWVLTAAHCVEGASLSEFKIAMGSDLENPEKVLSPAAVLTHPTYFERPYFGGDLALIQLDQRLEDVEPARLNADSAFANQQSDARILGWGRTAFQGNSPSVFPSKLQQADTKVLSRDTLNTLPYYGGAIQADYIPVGQSNPIRAAFSGDSGGPVLIKDGDGAWLVAGVASWGSGGCGGPYDHITMYSDVGYHADWIEEVVSISESYHDPEGWDPTFERAPDSNKMYVKIPLWPRNGEEGSVRWGHVNNEPRRGIFFDDFQFPSESYFARLIESQGRVYGLVDFESVSPGQPKFWRGPKSSAPKTTPGPYPIRPFQTLMLSGRYRPAQAIRVVGLDPETKYKLPQDEYRYDGYTLYGLEGGHLSQIASASWSRPEPFGGISEALFFSTDDASAYPWQIIPGERAEIAAGQTHRGALSESSHPFYRAGQRVESIKVVGTEYLNEVQLEAFSVFDAEIAIFDQDGRAMLHYDQQARGATEKVIVTGDVLRDGVVRISNFDADDFGNFTLSARSHASKSSLRLGETERRAVTTHDRYLEQSDGTPQYYEVIPLIVSGSGSVTVSVRGVGDFLPGFAVFDDNDLLDSAGGSYCEDPVITFTPKTGMSYELYVAVFDESELNGNYDVSFNRTSALSNSGAGMAARSEKARRYPFHAAGARPAAADDSARLALIDAYLHFHDSEAL